MAVSREQVLATAALCRIDLGAGLSSLNIDSANDYVDLLAGQLGAVVKYMDILNQVDTSNVEPLYSPQEEFAPPREDKAEKRRTAGEILANAPKRQNTFFVVPPVI